VGAFPARGGTLVVATVGIEEPDEEGADEAAADVASAAAATPARMAAGTAVALPVLIPATLGGAGAGTGRAVLDRSARPGPILTVTAPVLRGRVLAAELEAGRGGGGDDCEVRVEETVVVP